VPGWLIQASSVPLWRSRRPVVSVPVVLVIDAISSKQPVQYAVVGWLESGVATLVTFFLDLRPPRLVGRPVLEILTLYTKRRRI
jgi:hypothetical protein